MSFRRGGILVDNSVVIASFSLHNSSVVLQNSFWWHKWEEGEESGI